MARMIMHGVSGRMGRAIVEVAAATDGIEVVAGIDRAEAAADLKNLSAVVPGLDGPILSPEQYDASPIEADVMIDFSTKTAVPSVCALAKRHNLALVCGTTGIEDEERQALEELAGSVGVVWAPNMSLGVNLLFQLLPTVRQALGQDYDIEVVEIHHKHKLDAPSGTAKGLVRAINLGGDELDQVHGREGMVGARKDGELGVHAVRAGDVVGDHTVYFAGPGERIELTHRAHSRGAFASGAVKAAMWVTEQPAGQYSMADVLGLSNLNI